MRYRQIFGGVNFLAGTTLGERNLGEKICMRDFWGVGIKYSLFFSSSFLPTVINNTLKTGVK